MTTIRDVIGRCSTQLNDALKIRYEDSKLLDYFNDSLRAMITVRADVGASVEDVPCVAGSQQQLPDGAIRLLDVTRVKGGRAVTPIPKEVLDSYDPDWHMRSGSPQRYVYDEQTPKVFWLCPAPLTETVIEAKVSRIPPAIAITELDDAVPVDELYVNAIIEWILFRAFSEDAEGGANLQIAAQHLQIFNDQMGIKTQADVDQGMKKQQQYNGSTQK